MKAAEAKDLVVGLILEGVAAAPHPVLVEPASPDGDPAKFSIAGRPARAIVPRDGWYLPINLSWFADSFDPPAISGGPFHWYVLAIPRGSRYRADHYFICDYLQMRQWVRDFGAPLGDDHRDHYRWRADLRLYPDEVIERRGYFRWGDEPPRIDDKPDRVFEVDNVGTLGEPVPLGQHVGTFGVGGESAAHRLLKEYVAAHPTELGLTPAATARIEYLFATGDKVDVLFENHFPDRTVVEVEVEGEANICVGIQQAIKYRSLAAVDAGYPLLTSRVRSLVAAYATEYPRAVDLAEKYDVSLMSVNRELVLATAV
jgi:hypothetical protein